MRDLVAFSTLPAVWIGLDRDGIARSLADALLHTLSLEYIYIRIGGNTEASAVEVTRSKERKAPQEAALTQELARVLETGRADAPTTIPDPLGAGTLRVAVTRFGVADDNGCVVACSRSPEFPTEQDRLLLGVAANQTAVVVQRRQAEQRVQEQREWLQVTLASIGDAVITTDTEGRVTYLNTVAEQLTGWTLDDATGKPLATVFSILNEETLQPVESPVQKVLREGSVSGLANHTVLVAKNGTLRPIDDSAAPIRDASGQMIGVVMVFRAVSAQRKAEQHRNVRLAVTHALNEAATVQDMAQRCLARRVRRALGGISAVSGAVDDSGERLRLQRELAPAGRAGSASRAQPVVIACSTKGEGLPGRVWAGKQSTWIRDLSKDRELSAR